KKIININKGSIPPNVVIQTWFSFLIEHGVKPYQYWDERVMGMELSTTASGIKYRMKNGIPVYYREDDDFYRHYFNSRMDIYSDKLSKLVFRCNEKSGGFVIKRLEKIFTHIYIDEIQDMAGWDLDLIKLIMESSINLTMVGDPRQTVYLTHNDKKYQKYTNGKIKDFIQTECRKIPCDIDETTLNVSHRNSSKICALSSSLFPDLPECKSDLKYTNEHMGVFFIESREFDNYFRRYNPMQLRYSRSTVAKANASIMNFGESKGLDFNHVIIYPTKDMLTWLCCGNNNLEESTRAKLYVAITRAYFSVGIIVEDNFNKDISGITLWSG
ncbi:MAG: UvrD-helicase domain-containing protein, partial [Eubacteriaceae bacterium]